ncbi:MAG: hypothetical protein H6924_00020 [Alphaproteobacteria bacterium]|nr:hypothetical protein [Alphaproteobacteria bacterium]
MVEDATFVGKQVVLEDGEHAPVEVDPLGIRRLLGNLVENAVKYGSGRGCGCSPNARKPSPVISDDGPLAGRRTGTVFQPSIARRRHRASSNKHMARVLAWPYAVRLPVPMAETCSCAAGPRV